LQLQHCDVCLIVFFVHCGFPFKVLAFAGNGSDCKCSHEASVARANKGVFAYPQNRGDKLFAAL
jgi:hypothetical protein